MMAYVMRRMMLCADASKKIFRPSFKNKHRGCESTLKTSAKREKKNTVCFSLHYLYTVQQQLLFHCFESHCRCFESVITYGYGWLDNDKFLVGVPSKVMVVMVIWDVWVIRLVRVTKVVGLVREVKVVWLVMLVRVVKVDRMVWVVKLAQLVMLLMLVRLLWLYRVVSWLGCSGWLGHQ